MRWRQLLIFYMKRIAKSKLYVGTSFLFFLLLLVRLIMHFNNPFGQEEYGQLPGEVAMIVQMVSLFYIIYFYLQLSNELLYGIQTFFVDGYRILLEKISSLFTSHVIIQGILFIITYIIFSGTYLSVGIEMSEIYISLFRFLIVYMFVPLTFTMLYGTVVAMFFGKNKISFFPILIIWILSGSMASELFVDFFSTIPANDWRIILLLGMNSVEYVYQSYIGFDIHLGNELKLITWFLVLVEIILILSLRWSLVKKERRNIVIIVSISLFISIASANGVKEFSTKTFSRADNLIETQYYKDLDKPGEGNIDYEIEAYTINIGDSNATVQVDFSSINTTNPTFQLYHAYPINWIKADDYNLEFKRYGDIIQVELRDKNVSSISFQYEIIDTNLVPYTNKNSVLLANMAWYPKKRKNQLYEFDETTDWIKLTEDFNDTENYHFTLEVSDPLFSNLPKVGKVYQGNAQAVTIIYGEGNQLQFDNYQITYPADWPKMEERLPIVITRLEEILKEIKLIAPTAVNKLPSKLVFSNYGLTSFMIRDHLVYNTGYGEALNSETTMKDFPLNILKFTVPEKGSNLLFEEWINMSSDYIREVNNWETNMFGMSSTAMSLPLVEQETIHMIYNLFGQLSMEKKRQFLHDWYLKMEDDWTWEQVVQLLERRM